MKPPIIIKLTGIMLQHASTGDTSLLQSILAQITTLHERYHIGIVIGGGNFFRGSEHGKQLDLSPETGHHIGMLATAMNGHILTDLLMQNGVPAVHLCAISSIPNTRAITDETLLAARRSNSCVIFSGGTGNPFFTTDTAAVLRAIQTGAIAVWKATNVDGIFDKDPRIHPEAQRLPKITYRYALEKKLGVMDATAYALAETHALPIRIFNIFDHNALLTAAHDLTFGSTIC